MLLGVFTLTGLESGLLYTALGVYAGATAVGARVFTGRRRGRALRSMLAIGTIALTLLLVALAYRERALPILRRSQILLFAAWCLAVAGWLMDRRKRMPVVAAVMAPTVGLLTFFALLLTLRNEGIRADVRFGPLTHVLLAVLGLACLTLSAAVGAYYVWQIRTVKRNPKAAVGRKLPSLLALDRVNYYAAAIGFPLLALSVLAGWLFLAPQSERAGRWFLDPTVLATLAGLLVYVVLFGARAFLGWRGRRIAWLTVIGFVVLIVGFVVAAYCTSPSVMHQT